MPTLTGIVKDPSPPGDDLDGSGNLTTKQWNKLVDICSGDDAEKLPNGALDDIAQSKVTNLVSDLAGKAASSHTHNASDVNAGTLTHERGGLEADVSAYSGLVKISGGATSAVTAPTGDVVGTTDSQTLSNKTITLGGQLDPNGNAIGDGTRELLTFVEDGSAVNHVEIENEATGNGPIIRATGDDATVDLHLATKSWGEIKIDANTDLQDYDLSGVGQLTLSDTSQLTIATGAVTATGPVHTISCETGTSDDLDTINTFIGLLAIRQHTSTDTITVKHGTAANKIQTTDGADLAMTARGYLLLYRKTTSEAWIVVGGAGGGGGGTVTFTDMIKCTVNSAQGAVAYSDVHSLATAGAKTSGWVMPGSPASDPVINFKVVVPKDLAASPAAKWRVIYMTMGTSTTETVVLLLKHIAIADTEDLDQALVNTTSGGDSGALDIPNATESLDYYEATFQTQPVADDVIIGQLTRESFSDVNDDFTSDILVIEIQLLIDRTIG